MVRRFLLQKYVNILSTERKKNSIKHTISAVIVSFLEGFKQFYALFHDGSVMVVALGLKKKKLRTPIYRATLLRLILI